MKIIENNLLRIEINPVGAELSSIFNKVTNREMLWQGSSEFWTGRAPVLFPIVGALKDDTVIIDQETYHMPQHGFVRNNNQLELALSTRDTLDFQLSANENTLKQYPYHFAFNVRFSLRGNQLEIRHTVKNEDSKTLYFSTGGHPAFNCPFGKGEAYNDYYLEFENEEHFTTWRLNQDRLIGDEQETVAPQGAVLPIHDHIFDHGALIFTELKSRKVSLRHSTNPEVITVHYPDFPHLGIWSKPGAPFVCIEPWLGYADRWNTTRVLSEKEGIQKLEAGDMFQASYLIEVNS